MRTAIFAVVMATACGGGSSKSSTMAKSDGASCAAVADAMLAPLSEGKDQTKAMLDKKEELAGVIRARCDEDAWNEEARRCFTTMKTVDDADRCGTLLTEEQQTKLKAKFGPEPPPEPEASGAPPAVQAPVEEKARPAPKTTKSKKAGDPCDGGE